MSDPKFCAKCGRSLEYGETDAIGERRQTLQCPNWNTPIMELFRRKETYNGHTLIFKGKLKPLFDPMTGEPNL